jgi:endonuclease/exonuclease/phosphatase family metal-dependent hydrolase
MRVATANIHADVDGYGRPTDALTRVLALQPDLLFVQELWRGTEDHVERIEAAGLPCVGFEVLGEARRFREVRHGNGWEPRLGLLTGDEGLYFSSQRPLSARRQREHDLRTGGDDGAWGFGVFTRHTVEHVERLPVRQLRRDKVRRSVLVADLTTDDGTLFSIVAVHGPHLSHGSLRHYRQLARLLQSRVTSRPVILAGDFNCWRPLLRTVFPGWRSAVRAKTWPAWRPHSQIDHIFLRGAWKVSDTSVVRTGSDHRALVANLEI